MQSEHLAAFVQIMYSAASGAVVFTRYIFFCSAVDDIGALYTSCGRRTAAAERLSCENMPRENCLGVWIAHPVSHNGPFADVAGVFTVFFARFRLGAGQVSDSRVELGQRHFHVGEILSLR